MLVVLLQIFLKRSWGKRSVRAGGRARGRACVRAGVRAPAAHLPCDSWYCFLNMKIFVCFIQQASLLAMSACELGGICKCS
jgi:hypothetical protein